jgi:parvulin-like peptidyl-prolyl isomerase
MMPSALQFIFNATIGEVSDPIENDNFFAVFTVDSVLAPGSKPFEDVKDAIKSQMTRERTTDETEILSGEFRKQVDDGAPFDSLIAWNENLEHAEKDKKTLSRGFTSIGRGNFINGALLNAQAGELLGPIKTSRGYTLMKVLEVQEFDSTTYVVQKDGLRTTLQRQKRNAAYGDWLNAKTEEAEIVDNRKFHGYN